MNSPCRPKVFCPQDGQLYFYILPCTDKLISSKLFDHADSRDRDNFFLGNCFETEAEVVAAIEWLRVRALLRYYSAQSDWTYSSALIPIWEEKIGTNRESGFYLDFSENVYREGVYFPSRDAFEEAINKIGKDRVKRYMGVKW